MNLHRLLLKPIAFREDRLMMELKMAIYPAEIILAACISFIAGQSTSLTPSPSVQQTMSSVVNQTATANVSMTVSSNYSLFQQQISSIDPSSTVPVSFHSSVMSTSPVTTKNDDDDDIKDDTEEKKKIALIAASCTGGVVLLLGLTIVIWTHIRNRNA